MSSNAIGHAQFFQLYAPHEEAPARWFLRGPIAQDGRPIDPRVFTTGERVRVAEPLYIPLRRAGERLDFTLADFGMPVLLSTFADALAGVAGRDIQRFRARVEGDENAYDIINILPVVDCLDEERSDVTRWNEPTSPPDMVGRYLTVSNIHIDSARTAGKDVFRLAGWKPAIIVSQRVREVLKTAAGAVFEPV